ncbi:glycosyltransferase [bacterium]|nr:glycosyltransferase [bacterium]
MISIIVPVYNAEKYLRRCINSVRAQTYDDWELICINDGSTDNSGDILDEYASRDARVRVITKENAGVSAARNDGLAMARGNYVLFLDADDFIHPQTLEITHRIACDAGVDIVSFRHDARLYNRILNAMCSGRGAYVDPHIRCYNPAHVTYVRTDCLAKYTTERNHSMGWWRIRHCYPVMHLYRRDLIANMRFDTDIRIAEDFPWWTRIIFAHPRAAVTRLPLYYYIPNGASALNSVQSMRLFDNVSRAIIRSYDIACRAGRPCELRRWRREFLWPFIFTCMRAVRGCTSDADIKFIKSRLHEMQHAGCFDNPVGMRACKYRRIIYKFLSE